MGGPMGEKDVNPQSRQGPAPEVPGGREGKAPEPDPIILSQISSIELKQKPVTLIVKGKGNGYGPETWEIKPSGGPCENKCAIRTEKEFLPATMLCGGFAGEHGRFCRGTGLNPHPILNKQFKPYTWEGDTLSTFLKIK